MEGSVIGLTYTPYDGANGYCKWLRSLSRLLETGTDCSVPFIRMMNTLSNNGNRGRRYSEIFITGGQGLLCSCRMCQHKL